MPADADAADHTELAGVADMGTEAVEAWALEDYPETGSWEDPERRLTPKRVTILAVSAAVVVLGAAAGAVAWQLQREHPVHTTRLFISTETETAVVTTVVVAEPPPALRSPKASPRMPSLAIFDNALINNLRRRGWTVGDESNLVDQGHLACDMLRRGVTPVEVVRRMESGTPPFTPSDARSFLKTVMVTYPDCP